MNTAERIYAEVRCLPEALADRVLDFVLFLGQKHAPIRGLATQDGTQELPDEGRHRAVDAQESDLKPVKEAIAELMANTFPLKEGALPIKRDDLYDRSCLR